MILWSVKKETDIRRGRHCVFLMHVHLVFVTRYRLQIFDHDATEKLRTYFSNVRLLRRDRPDIAVRYYYKGVLWSPGYFASSCGGAPISVIRQYIEQQQTPG
ncbi:transposase [Escherichia coli]|uniref:transposase n=1 Tax=Escherichia coli TaxID=562 RepID=UPI000DAB8935|nr:transposase [Escherichia coli]PZY27924.1 IS200/IS605 family transposase [Escherichia coli]